VKNSHGSGSFTVVFEQSALQFFGMIGYPGALKVASHDVIHETEIKGISLNIKNRLQLGRAFKEMIGEEFLTPKMAPEGLGVIIGGRRDREFGPVVLFGLGGIFVEMPRMCFSGWPLLMKMKLKYDWRDKGSLLLKGFRGQAPRDVRSLINAW